MVKFFFFHIFLINKQEKIVKKVYRVKIVLFVCLFLSRHPTTQVNRSNWFHGSLVKLRDVLSWKKSWRNMSGNSNGLSSFRTVPSTWSESASYLSTKIMAFYLALLYSCDTCFGRLLALEAELAYRIYIHHTCFCFTILEACVMQPTAKTMYVSLTCTGDRQNIGDSDRSLTKI